MGDIFENEIADLDDNEGGEDLSGLEDDSGECDLVESESVEYTIDLPLYQLYLPYAHESVYASTRGDPIPCGTKVLVPTRYGRDLAIVQRILPNQTKRHVSRVAWIVRTANDADLEKLKVNTENEVSAFTQCKEKIAAHHMDMKLISAHFLLDEPKIIFFFTSENRVDFRELVKDLVSIFKIRIELRQIGIRDEARIVGGMGHCGRDFCCHAVADKMKPVSIKMAKEQNMSLNSMKISGHCGRLLCCLGFEYNFYNEARRTMPLEGAKISYKGELWKVTETNLIIGMITMTTEDGSVMRINKTQFEKADGKWVVKKPAAQITEV